MTTEKYSLRQVQDRFARHARDYVASEGHARGLDLDLLLEMARPQMNWAILDIATGGGHTALKIAPHVAWVVASDLSHGMLRAAQDHIAETNAERVEFACADAELLPFQSGAFDLVACRIAAHHFQDVFGFISASWRVLKNGGRLVVQDHVLPDDPATAHYVDAFERTRDPTHNRAFTEQQWRTALEEAGFDVERSELLVKRHNFLEWVSRQSCTQQAIEQLTEMLERAPEAASQWLLPLAFGKPEASFINHHIVIAGRKPWL